jgi:hypothetical protein
MTDFLDDFLDPTGALDVEQFPLAPRLDTLQGKVLGIVDNGKTNGDKFLKMVAEELQELHGVAEYKMLRKPDLSQPAPHELIEELSTSAHFAITGIGD